MTRKLRKYVRPCAPFIFLVLTTFGLKYPAIGQSMEHKNLAAVVHKDNGRYEIISPTEAYFKSDLKVTIYRAEANHFAKISKWYDDLSSVKIVSAAIYDSKGSQIYKLKKSDIVDQSSVSGISIFEDDRVKRLDLSRQNFPYTIEYKTLEEYNHTFYIPNWYVQTTKNVLVESSRFEILAPTYLEPRVYQKNIPDSSFKRAVIGGSTVNLQWEFQNITPLEREIVGKDRLKYLPIINTSPSRFEYGGYEGDFSTWDDFALWIESLNSGRDNLAPEAYEEIRKRVEGLSTDREKIREVYDYLQSNTRYVSIQLGIGGYQPFLTSTVHNEGYGDCKALSFYTKSLLKSVGIESKYALISAGDNPRPIIPDFPQSNFNHAILCVPNKGDTVWLECTSQTNPFGYLGSFTGNRKAFLIDDGKGKIVNTIAYNESSNIKETAVQIDLTSNGDAQAKVRRVLKGLAYEEDGLSFVLHMSDDTKKKWMMRNTGFSNFNLKSYQLEFYENELPEAIVESEYELKKYARVSGKRLFFDLNPFGATVDAELSWDKVKLDDVFELAPGVTLSDSVIVNVPEGYRFEYLPERQVIKSAFGSFESELVFDDRKVVFKRELILKGGSFPVKDFNQYLEFLSKLNQQEKPKVVMNKST